MNIKVILDNKMNVVSPHHKDFPSAAVDVDHSLTTQIKGFVSYIVPSIKPAQKLHKIVETRLNWRLVFDLNLHHSTGEPNQC